MITSPADKTAAVSRALIIFAKQPLPGVVKTRLSPPLTGPDTAELYLCMLQDTLAMVQTLAGICPFIYFQDDAGAAGYFSSSFPTIPAEPQQGRDLGERMKRAFIRMFDCGFSEVAIIGSDSPDLPPAYIHEAFRRLGANATDVVFGPSADGGYYLLALKRVVEGLFVDIPWSSGDVLAASIARAKEANLGVALLPQWYDIDTPADLQRPSLRDEKSSAVRTGEFLRRMLLVAN